MQRLNNPLPLFINARGGLLDAGFVYVGEADKDPEDYPLDLYLDPDLTVPIDQPLRTIGGMIVSGMSPVFVYMAEADYSTQGDNLKIDGITCSISAGLNRNVIRIDRNQGAVIQRLENCNVLVTRSRGMSISAVHNEAGYLEFRGSDVTLSDSFVWIDPDTQNVLDPVSGSDLGFTCPIRHTRYSTSTPAGFLSLRNVGTVYIPGKSLADEYSDADIPDLLLETGGNASFDNFFRVTQDDNFDGARSMAKISRYSGGSTDAGAVAAPWENVSSLAAKAGYYASNRIAVENGATDIPASYAAFSGTLNPSMSWRADAGTYYYRVVILHGPRDRLLARTTAEFSASPTASGNCVRIAGANTSAAARPSFTNTTMRIYRGTTTASYDRFVDLPVGERLDVFDLGYFLSTGERWKSRSAGDIDSFNTSSTFTRITVADDKNCVLYGTTALPSVGTWVSGDRFIGTTFTAQYDGSAWVLVAGVTYTNNDIGNANLTVPQAYAGLIRANTAITADRTVTLPAANKAGTFTVVRTASASGAFNILVKDAGGSTLATLSTTGSVTLAPTGSGWVVNS